MKKSLFKILVVSFLSTSAFSINAAGKAVPSSNKGDNYQLELVTKDISIPWGMIWLSDNELLVTDRAGEMRLIKDGKLLEKAIGGVPKVHARSQGGLLDVEIDPNYSENGWIYFSYSGYEGEGGGTNTSIMRARLKDMQLVDNQLLFHGYPNTKKSHHYGSRIEFDKDGYLFFSVGDRGKRDEHPQRLDQDAGKVHRINSDGSVPETNPFVSDGKARKSIYSIGHRNPQGMAMHPETGDIWTHEHGPRGGDEINIIKPGLNYGWPEITYGINYDGTTITNETAREGMEQPHWIWTPSIAPSAMQFVTSDKYPAWKGHLLVGSLKFAHMVLVELDGSEITVHGKMFEGMGRVRSMATHPDGTIYVGTDGNGIFRVVPKK